MQLTGTEAQQRNAVGACCIHHLSSPCDPSGEAWEGAETIVCDAWPLKADLALLHHSIYLQKRQWDKCLACSDVSSQEFLPSAQTEQMTSFPSFTLLPRQCHSLFQCSQRGLHMLSAPSGSAATRSLSLSQTLFPRLRRPCLPVPCASPSAHLGMWTQHCAVISI